MLIVFAAFVVFSVISLLREYKKDKKSIRIIQIALLLLFHLASFLSIFLQIHLGNAPGLSARSVLTLYIGQVLFLMLMAVVIPLFTELNRNLNLVMCMFITVGFVIQTRLDFDVAVRQFFILLFGAVMFFVFVFFCKRAKFLRNLTWVYFGVSAALLVLVLVLAQYSYGAKLAIDLGFISFQPMEFVKILFVLFVAAAFHHANNIKTVIITAVCAAIHCGILALCNDLGSALTIFVIYVLMVFVARKNIFYIIGGFVGLGAAGFAGYKLFPHVRVRISSWIDPWSDIDNRGYQIAQSLFAIGTGGWFGVGLFGGSPNSIPVVNNDFVFSAICEEMGGLFGIFLILLCLCFALMMMKIAIKIEMVFYKLLAFGLAATYAFQVFLTIGGVIKFIPSTGMNIPLISSGGSSLLGSMIIFGMIQALYVLSVHNNVKGVRK
ncbi:MAG: FtsW/RodA/SpoVE family cell cycle protein [Lachnospiraceae bacterium]|nr:FtsW/RodA/SpoVE family cell cycle protein [Lachnospiraceae bacterium]